MDVETVYAAFADCPSPGFFEGPVRELTVSTLDDYLTRAVTTWGSVDDFRHYVPRILDLLVTDRLPRDADPEIVLGKLNVAAWSTWPRPQREAVAQLLRAYWIRCLATYPGPRPIEDTLCALAQAVDDLTPLLEHWSALPTPAAARHLLDLLAGADQVELRSRRRLRDAFWHSRPAQQEQAVAWLLSPALIRAVESAFFAAGADPDLATSLSALRDLL